MLRHIEISRTGGQGIQGLRALEQASLQRIMENSDEGIGAESDTQALISERLVVFKNIEELQDQNQVLRRTVRNLSQKMELLEADRSRQRDDAVSKDMDEAVKTIESLQEQLRIQTLKLDTFVRERDQWKKIAETRSGAISPPKEMGSRSASPSVDFTRSIEFERLYKELQYEFEVYRKESNTNVKMLKDQIDGLNQEKIELTIQSARLNTQVNYQQERYSLLVNSTDGQAKELSSLREKLSSMGSTLTKYEAKSQEATIAYQEARQNLEIFRSENQQMKIEKEVWKASEGRAVQERLDLTRERNAAIDRLRELQHQMDDKDRVSTAERKRLEERLEEEHKELQSSRKQLSDLMEEHRSMSARHDLEAKDVQSKTEQLSTNLEKGKGELLLSKNKESFLNERVQDLSARLKAAEEKLAIHEGRSKLAAQTGASPEDNIKDLELKLNQARYDHLFIWSDQQTFTPVLEMRLKLSKSSSNLKRNGSTRSRALAKPAKSAWLN